MEEILHSLELSRPLKIRQFIRKDGTSVIQKEIMLSEVYKHERTGEIASHCRYEWVEIDKEYER